MPEISADDALPTEVFDLVVVGAGVVGCAVARRLTLQGARVLVLEQADDILDGASKGNSAILHTGFDAPPGSLEQRCLADGYAEYLSIRESLNLPLLETGALVLAWNESEVERLEGIVATARRNGVENLSLLDRAQVHKREPAVSPRLHAAVLVPGEFVIDPWSAPYAYLLQALDNGASLLRGCKLDGGEFDGGQWRLDTARGELHCRYLVSCTGLYGDLTDRALLGDSSFEIRPRKGQFVVFDKSARALTGTILLPVPSEKTKGIVVCPTIFGNLLVGPTAEEQDSRSDAGVERQQLEALVAHGREILPALAAHDITAVYAGIRPATEKKQYRITRYPDRHYISVGGIRSTGLSAALGIARYVHALYAGDDTPQPLPAPACRRVANLAEQLPRDWHSAGNGGIVCHCERVTRREIRAALDGDLPPRTLAGLKRRTRVTMGPCQGFYCSAELSELTADRFAEPLAGALE